MAFHACGVGTFKFSLPKLRLDRWFGRAESSFTVALWSFRHDFNGRRSSLILVDKETLTYSNPTTL